MKADLTQGNVARVLVAFTVPLVLSGLFQQFFNWVDAFIVGNIVGESALAGIGATSSIYNLFVMVITGFTSGLSVLVAQKAGSGDEEASRGILSTYGVVLTALLAAYLFTRKGDLPLKLMNTVLVSLMVIVIGYSSYALTLIRATADTPMNQNSPSDIFTLRTYLAREQYGKTPLFYGQTYVSEVKRENQGGTCVVVSEQGAPTWSRVIKADLEPYHQEGQEREGSLLYLPL